MGPLGIAREWESIPEATVPTLRCVSATANVRSQSWCDIQEKMTAIKILAVDPDTQGPSPNRRVEIRSVRKVRYTRSEWSMIAGRARACGKPPARYVRETSLGVVPKSRSSQIDAALIRELGRIGTQLTRLASTSRGCGASTEASTLDSVLAEILSVVRRLG